MEDKKDPEFNLILFYSNTKLSTENADSKIGDVEHHPIDSLNVIYFNRWIDIT